MLEPIGTQLLKVYPFRSDVALAVIEYLSLRNHANFDRAFHLLLASTVLVLCVPTH